MVELQEVVCGGVDGGVWLSLLSSGVGSQLGYMIVLSHSSVGFGVSVTVVGIGCSWVTVIGFGCWDTV